MNTPLQLAINLEMDIRKELRFANTKAIKNPEQIVRLQRMLKDVLALRDFLTIPDGFEAQVLMTPER